MLASPSDVAFPFTAAVRNWCTESVGCRQSLGWRHGAVCPTVVAGSISGMQESAWVVVWRPGVEEVGGLGLEKWFVVLVI